MLTLQKNTRAQGIPLRPELKPFWRKAFSFNWRFGLFLLLLLCIPRFVLVLQANATGRYNLIGIVMFIYALTPFLFLTKLGRSNIGIKKPSNYAWLFAAFFLGLAASFFLYWLGQAFYANSYDNWYAYIGKSYKIPDGMPPPDKALMFSIVALTGMTFSPIGEEFLFRGIVHESFARSIGDEKASIVDSSAFALVHLSHFGLVFLNQRWSFLPLPAFIWVAGMFAVSRLFWVAREKVNSIFGAVVCHAAFNLGMTYSIFYLLKPL